MSSLTNVPVLMTTAEAARLVRVTDRTIRRWVRDGRLVATHTCPGGRVLIQRADLLRLVGIDEPEPPPKKPRGGRRR